MPKVNIKAEAKEQNFDAIAPLKQTPILVATNSDHQTRSKIGPVGFLFVLLFLFSLAGVGWLYRQNTALQTQIKDIQESETNLEKLASESMGILDKINQHILLPHDQSPSISTIENVNDLKKKETFFEYAQDGDVLVQFNSLEIIYNPVADVIVNVRTRGTVAGAETRAVQGAITIDIRNGAGVAGLAGRTAESFKGVKDYIVQNVGNAVSSNYGKTIIVNLAGKDIGSLEKQFNAQAVRDLPQGEQPSSADVVIILGKG